MLAPHCRIKSADKYLNCAPDGRSGGLTSRGGGRPIGVRRGPFRRYQ
jgi:hypothetical protein